MKSKEVFAANARDEETQRLTALEAGERGAMRSEEYDLRVLGLAGESGVAKAEGIVLLDFLRGGGKLYRRGDDKDVLRLGERLRVWMGMESVPFQFTPSRRLWTATFDCASLRTPQGRQWSPEVIA